MAKTVNQRTAQKKGPPVSRRALGDSSSRFRAAGSGLAYCLASVVLPAALAKALALQSASLSSASALEPVNAATGPTLSAIVLQVDVA